MTATERIADKIEAIMDSEGVTEFAAMCACVCREKADHLRCNWQDEGTAKVWDRLALRFEQTHAFAHREGLP